MKRLLSYPQILLLIFLWRSVESAAQSGYSLKGIVVDSKTREPIPFASVFLSTTMIGTQTSDTGTYLLQNIPPAKYDLMVSSVGYKSSKQAVLIEEKATMLNISLEPDVKVLKEVTIQSKQSDYRRQMAWFKKYFLGETRNASKCEIMNLDQIGFKFDKEDSVLTAWCDEPIEVENRALGYLVLYYLDEFKLDFRAKKLKFGGTPYFRPVSADQNESDFKLVKARDRAYYGSMNHFMRSLRARKLGGNQFTVYALLPTRGTGIAAGNPVRNNPTTINPPPQEYYEIDSHIILDLPHKMPFQLRIIYDGETQEYNYSQRQYRLSLPQISQMKFLSHNLVIHENGYYDDPFQFELDGYWGWSDKVLAELLPLEYEPTLSIKEKLRMEKLDRIDSLRAFKARSLEGFK